MGSSRLWFATALSLMCACSGAGSESTETTSDASAPDAAETSSDASPADVQADPVADTSAEPMPDVIDAPPDQAPDPNDGGVDAPLAPCVSGDWGAAQVGPDAPLAVQPGLLWSRLVNWGRLIGDAVLFDDRIAFSGASAVFVLDREANIVEQVWDSNSSGTIGCGLAADTDGNFFWATSSISSFTKDGVFRWKYDLGPNIAIGTTITYVRNLVVSPSGIVFAAATDGYLHALAGSDGTLLWKKPLEFHAGQPWIGVGLGNMVAYGQSMFSMTGERFSMPKVNGRTIYLVGAFDQGLIASWYEFVDPETYNYYGVLDTCYTMLWSFPEKKVYGGFPLLGPDDSMYREYYQWSDAQRFSSVYDPDGAPIKGPSSTRGAPSAIGADGFMYQITCSTQDLHSGEMDIVGYTPDLAEAWTLSFGTPCTDRSLTLADDGVLYATRYVDGAGVELIAVQTASPGLARGGMGTRGSDNRRSNWYGKPASVP